MPNIPSLVSPPFRSPIAGGLRVALILLLPAGSPAAEPTGADYLESIAAWQQGREERLRSETGWLTIVGLFWLQPGDNRFGSDPRNPVLLPAGPGHAGRLHLETGPEGARVVVFPEPGTDLRIDSDSVLVETVVFAPGEETPRLQLDRLEFWVIQRGDQYAVRLRDPESSLRTGFTGIDNYPVDPAYRVNGTLEIQDPPERILLPNTIGFIDTVYTPGLVHFELNGESLSLFPLADGPTDSTLFFVFADGTTGSETYEPGRFLYTRIEPDGRIDLDFNKAYNPPCAINPNTTCPLPPPGNTLAVPVRAGEKNYAPEAY